MCLLFRGRLDIYFYNYLISSMFCGRCNPMSRFDRLPAGAWPLIIRFIVVPVGANVVLGTVEWWCEYWAERRRLSGALTMASGLNGIVRAFWHEVLESDHRELQRRQAEESEEQPPRAAPGHLTGASYHEQP